MKPSDPTELRAAVLRRLRLFGIKVKHSFTDGSYRTTAPPQMKVFGVPLHHLQMTSVPEYGLVPCFLVDSCRHLLNHAGCEGLFRKSGSVVRIKALKARLDEGEACLSAALPCDVAGLVKQFFHDLPCPVLSPVFLQALMRAQRLPTEEERITATQLVSCLLPEISSSTLSYFFNFLKQVSLRSSENKMDSYNLSVVFSPSLFHLHSTPEWSGAYHRLHIAVTCALIENAHTFGVVPDTITGNGCADFHLPCETDPGFKWKNKGRRSFEVTSLSTAETIYSKEKMLSGGAGDKLPRRKRKSFRHSLRMVPNALFGCCFDSSSEQQHSSPSAVLNRRLSNSGRHRGCTRVRKNVKRVVSEALCCVTSDSSEKSPPQSPVAPWWLQPYQDTPVGRLKKHLSRKEAVPLKPPQITRVFRKLFCTSAIDSPEDQQFLTLGEATPSLSNSSTVSACLQTGVTPQMKNTGATSCLEEQNTLGDVEEQVKTEKKYILPVKRSRLNIQDALTKNKELFQPSSSPLLLLQNGDGDDHNSTRVQTDVLDEDDFAKRLPVVPSARHNTTTANIFISSPVVGQSRRIPVTARHGVTSFDTCRVHLMELRTYSSKLLSSKITPKMPKVRVLDWVRKYETLHKKTLIPKTIQSPLKFQRTPVYQYVKRINSHLTSGQMTK